MIPFLRYILIVACVTAWAGCAIRVAPSGGEKDTTPPKVLKATPDTFATNFNSKTIELEFDEYFQVNDLTNKLVVSPPLENVPETKIKGKKLIISLNNNLRPNTTYNFNFGAAIADINENTPMSNYNYVFSTGSYIDSLTVSGQVKNAFSQGVEKEVTVMLYTDTGDSLPYKSKPAYFAKTDDGGNFNLNYIAPGKYKLFALKETNSNYLYDAEDEQVAFVDTLVSSAKIAFVPLRLFKAEKKMQRLVKNTFAKPGKLTLVFNKPVSNFALTDLKDKDNTNFYITEYNTRRDSLTIWFTKPQKDTLRLAVIDNEPCDTITFYPNKKNKTVDRGSSKNANVDTTLRVSTPFIVGGKAERGNTIELAFSHPVKDIVWSKVKLYSGTDTVPFKHVISDSVNRKATITYPFVEEVEYKLFAPKGAFTDIFGYVADTVKLPFTLKPERDYGTMQLNLTLPDGGTNNYILQLLNSKNEIVKEQLINKSQKIDYGLLLPGSYTFRLIDDSNKNGRWDTGNYLKHIQPETVLYSNEKPNVRSAWDMAVEWDLNKKALRK